MSGVLAAHADGLTAKTILWSRQDRAGHESARLSRLDSNWHLAGTAVFAHDQQPCCLAYHITCDSSWQTRNGKVTGWFGSRTIDITLSVDASRRWSLNGVECPVAGCIDLDLNFSPSWRESDRDQESRPDRARKRLFLITIQSFCQLTTPESRTSP